MKVVIFALSAADPKRGRYKNWREKQRREWRHFVMGIEHGIRTGYWPGGLLRARSFYKDGLKEGVAKSWHFDGKIATRSNFAKGKLIGKAERWFEAGAY